MSNPTELPILVFESKKKFADWLAKNHDKYVCWTFEVRCLLAFRKSCFMKP